MFGYGFRKQIKGELIGLEFNPGIISIPKDYDSINNLEYTK